ISCNPIFRISSPFLTSISGDNPCLLISLFLAGSLQDIRGAKIIGRKTFGKGVVQRIYTLSNSDQLKLTVAQWLTPKKREINKQGLSPDIEVKKGDDILKIGLQEIQK
ncbi:MAG: S41 family peptidase, partial [Flammeovirgaceae bacterium]